MAAVVFLIPTVLAEGVNACLPAYITGAVKQCDLFFVENERTARRYLKSLWKEMVIDDYQWYNIKEITTEVASAFKAAINAGKNIGILSEAGCPGVADPGQQLVALAHEKKATIKPLVGPSSILLALMASGMNGQQFLFHGYLPIDNAERKAAIKKLESESIQYNRTQIFIETPYRNNAMLEALASNCHGQTKLCIAADLTAPSEFIKTMTMAEWKKQGLDIHKRPAIFLIYAGK